MNIQRIGNFMEMYPAANRKPAAKVRGKEARDEITISKEARVFDFAKKAAAGVPDVREDRVAAIMKKLENGSYKIPASSIAAKIMG